MHQSEVSTIEQSGGLNFKMDSQSHQNSSGRRTQKLGDRSKNVLLEEHKHKSVAETGSETSGHINDLPRQLLARRSNTLNANNEDPVAVEENIQSVQHNNVYNLRTEGSSLSINATNISQPLRKRKTKYKSVAQLSESGVFTAKTKPPRYSRSISKKDQSKSAHASQRMSKRRDNLEPLQERISHDHEVLLRAVDLARSSSCHACSTLFWKEVEPIFASVREEDTSYLLKELELSEELNETQLRIPRSREKILDTVMSTTAGESTDHHHDVDCSSSCITLSQIALCALISEDEIEEVKDSEEFDYSSLEDIDETHARKVQYDISDTEYEKLNLNDKFRLELHSVDLYPQSSISKEIDDEIVQLQQRLHQQTENKKSYLRKIYELVWRSRDANKQNLEQTALDKLVQVAYENLLHNGAGKRTTHALLGRVLARCQEFERGGVSCFNHRLLMDMLLSAPQADSVASTIIKSSANRAPRSVRQRQTTAEGPSQDSFSGQNKKKRTYRRKASTDDVQEDKGKEIVEKTDVSPPHFEGIENADSFLDFDNADLGSGNDDFSFGLDIPMDDLSTVDMSIP